MNKNGTIPFNVFMTELMNSDDYTITPKTFWLIVSSKKPFANIENGGEIRIASFLTFSIAGSQTNSVINSRENIHMNLMNLTKEHN
jgi:hypothetical protein